MTESRTGFPRSGGPRSETRPSKPLVEVASIVRRHGVAGSKAIAIRPVDLIQSVGSRSNAAVVAQDSAETIASRDLRRRATELDAGLEPPHRIWRAIRHSTFDCLRAIVRPPSDTVRADLVLLESYLGAQVTPCRTAEHLRDTYRLGSHPRPRERHRSGAVRQPDLFRLSGDVEREAGAGCARRGGEPSQFTRSAERDVGESANRVMSEISAAADRPA